MPVSERFIDAMVLASALHEGQTRKGTGMPYLTHLMGVAALVMEYGGDDDEAVAALLHDAPEDHGGRETLALIHENFGDRVAGIVAAVSDSYDEPGEDKAPWRERKEGYLARLPSHDFSARLVGAADKLHNATAILEDLHSRGPEIWERFHGGREGTLWYYRAAADEFLRGGPAKLAKRLDETVTALERLAAKLG